MSRETRRLVLEVSLGIVLYNVILALMALLFYRKAPVFLGLLIGMAMGIAMFVHMAAVLDRVIGSGDARTAQRKATVHMALRYLVTLAVFVLILARFSRWINAIAVVIGALGLKAGAYLQPVIHKIFQAGETEPAGKEE